MQLIPVILCGEAELRPCSTDVHSLLQKIILRSALLPGVQTLIAITNQDIFYKVKEEFNELNLTHLSMSFILEPLHLNTAAAVTAAVLHIAQFHNHEALILVLAEEHLDIDQDSFLRTIALATAPALAGNLVTFGMHAYESNTDYYYPTANNNMFLWNSRLFLFKAESLLKAIDEYRPDILSATIACMNHSELTEENNALKLDLDSSSFFSIPDSSINDEVIKKSDKTIIMPCNLDWLDSGCLIPKGSIP